MLQLGYFLTKVLRAFKRITTYLLSTFWVIRYLPENFQQHLVDFKAFYGAAKKLLLGVTPYGLYQTAVGASSFQSPIWLSWLFIPLTLFNTEQAFLIFEILNLLLYLVILIIIFKWHSTKISFLDFFFFWGCSLVLSFLTQQFGQVTIIQLAAIVAMIYTLNNDKPIIAGMLFPLVLIKPHLVVFFCFVALKRGGRKMLLAGIGSLVIFVLIGEVIEKYWILDMIKTIIGGQQSSEMEWYKFMTLAGLFSKPLSVGILIWLITLPFLIFLDYRFRSLPNITWLPVALALSLATAPYAFAYDLPLLLPSLVWLCLPLSTMTILIAFVVTLIPMLVGFSGISYISVLIVTLLSIYRLFLLREENHFKFYGTDSDN